MRTITNLKSAKELIAKYRNITIKDLDIEIKKGKDILSTITNFGTPNCILCRNSKSNFSCNYCIYGESSNNKLHVFTNSFKLCACQSKSYWDISNKMIFFNSKKELQELLNLIYYRASVIERLIRIIESNPDKYEII